MNKLKVSTRLSLGFGILMLLMLIMGAMSLTKVSNIHQSLKLVVDDRVPKVAEINEVKVGIDQIAISLRNMVILSDAAEIKKELKKVESAREANGQRLEKRPTSRRWTTSSSSRAN